jgi:hypothetical protein
LAQQAKKYSGVVVDWGFHTDDLELLERIIRRGLNAWYFDGDRAAALISWRAAWEGEPSMTDDVWRAQVARLDTAWPTIQRLYPRRIITTLTPGPIHMPTMEIYRRIGVRPP